MSERLVTDDWLAEMEPFAAESLAITLTGAVVHEMVAELKSHRVQVARLADALPINEEADAQVTAALNRATAGYTKRKLTMPALKDEERELLEHARDNLADSDLLQWVGGLEQKQRALAVLDRLLATPR